MPDKPKYAEVKRQPRCDLEESLASTDLNRICNALYSAAQHEPDWRWSQAQCLRMLGHESSLVRSTALIALGEIALFQGNLDLNLVLPDIKRFASDPALGPYAEDALDNIRAAKIHQAIHNVAIQILRFVDGGFPGWVECELVDAGGRHHIIRDKVPIFTTEARDADSKYPMPGTILCEVLERYKDESGRDLVRVSTERPCYIESTKGMFEFIVPASLVTISPD